MSVITLKKWYKFKLFLVLNVSIVSFVASLACLSERVWLCFIAFIQLSAWIWIQRRVMHDLVSLEYVFLHRNCWHKLLILISQSLPKLNFKIENSIPIKLCTSSLLFLHEMKSFLLPDSELDNSPSLIKLVFDKKTNTLFMSWKNGIIWRTMHLPTHPTQTIHSTNPSPSLNVLASVLKQMTTEHVDEW